MFITKFGHCCLLIEENGLRILTDPGIFTNEQDDLKDLNAVIITHEHADHFHIDSLKKVITNNPELVIITNGSVGNLLAVEHIEYKIVDEGKSISLQNLLIEAFGTQHAEIYKSIPNVENTGYFIGERLFYPGDAFINPHKPVELLALPTVAPWSKVSEVIEYATAIAPKKWFPVHDAISTHPEMYVGMISKNIQQGGTELVSLPIGKRVEV